MSPRVHAPLPRPSPILWVPIVGIVYFAAGKLGLSLALVNASATAVWPPTGIALAALLVFGYRAWPGIFLGAFLVNLTTAGSVATSLGIACGNTLEGLAGTWLLLRFASGPRAFLRSRDIFRAAPLAGILSTTISATIGTASLSLGGLAGRGELGSIWLTWWLGDAAGDLIVAPLALLWMLGPPPRWGRFRSLEAALLALCVGFVGLVVFGDLYPPGPTAYATGFICFPLLVWPAFRFSQRETVTVAALLSAIAVVGTLRGTGPFAHAAPNDSLLLLQSFMSILTLTALAIAAEVSERKEYETKLVQMIDHDSLTGVMTRRRFLSDLERVVAEAHRYGTRGALMFLDVDNFKSMNDTLGHSAGDRILRSVAELLARRLRESDLLGRLGGDEFAILLPRTEGAQALEVALQLQEAIASHETIIDGRPFTITVSIGIALFPYRKMNVPDLLSHADLAMYQAKRAGRNLARIYVEGTEWQEKLAAGLSGEERIRKALSDGLFVLHAQPILDLRRDEIWRHELLLRMTGDDGRLVLPGVFLVAAERSGLIVEVDAWVVSQAIDRLARLPAAPGVCVNISETSLADSGFLSFVGRSLAGTPVDPGKLTLQITESAVSSNPSARDLVRGLRSLGCGVALDEFVAGAAFLDRLEAIPVDYLALDASLIRNHPGPSGDREVVLTVAERARLMGRKTIAKFVEDEETLRQLRAAGVDYAQGFHIGRPAPLTDMPEGASLRHPRSISSRHTTGD